ncbi:MAG: tetratricopeptide repeat protein [bacterium]|jgi:tetratricopeptide (TPR) repeat protein
MISLRRSFLTFFALLAFVTAQNVPLDALLRGGRIHFQGGRYERAREQFQKALDQYGASVDNPTRAQIHLWLGLCDAQLNRLISAAGHFLTALNNDSSIVQDIRRDEQQRHWTWTALIAASRENLNAGDYEPAIDYARAALLIEPTKSQTYTIIASAYSALGKFDEMLKTAREMLALNTGSAEAYSLIGLYYLQVPDSLLPKEVRRTRWDSTAYYYQQALKIYQARYDSAYADLVNILKLSDTARVRTIARELVDKQRYARPEELKRYIEKDLNQAKQLQPLAQVTSRLFYAANNLNVTSTRLGSALLRAAAETGGETASNYRSQAEALFQQALIYDPFDYSARFNLGIAQYQGKKDSLAMESFIRVIENTVVPVSKLPAPLQEQLLTLITPELAAQGYLEITGPLAAQLDSTVATLGYRGGGFNYLYFPDLRGRTDLSAPDPGKIFLSNENPVQLENIYLLLGVSQTGIGLSLIEAGKKDAGKELLKQATASLVLTTKINPGNAEAWLNLVHCYRETGEKDKAAAAYEQYKKLKQ